MQIQKEDFNDILSSHLQKEEKISLYERGVILNTINDTAVFRTTWSWWGFFAGWAFFLYRKMYLQAALFFIASVVATAIPFLGIAVAIISGMSAYFFYTKKLHKDLEIAGYKSKDFNEVKSTLEKLGGYNKWVIYLAIAFYGFFILLFLVSAIIATNA